jgi:hypothetical protein
MGTVRWVRANGRCTSSIRIPQKTEIPDSQRFIAGRNFVMASDDFWGFSV